MLSERRQNIVVGVTVLAALVALMYGILFLGKSPSLGAGGSYVITLVASNAGGTTAGAKVDLNGVVIGQVQSVSLGPDDKGLLQAKIMAQIDGRTEIPANATASLGKPSVGSAYVSLSSTDAMGPKLSRDGKAILTAVPGDAGLIPKDIRDNFNQTATEIRENFSALSQQLQVVAKDLHVLLQYNRPEEVDAAGAATAPGAATQGRPVENISTMVIRLDRTVKSLEALLTDRQLHTQVRETVQNVRDASVKLNTALASIDTTVKNADKAFTSFGGVANNAARTLDNTQSQIVRVSEKLVDMLAQIEKTTKQVAEGGGTTGKLINDPRLYEGLVDLSKSLRTTVEDLDFLLKKWKDEGVNFHLK